MKKQMLVVNDKKNGENYKVIMDNTGSISSIKNYVEKGNEKFYAVVMRCGHCTNKYSFIPIMFPVLATDSKSAAEIAMHLPRVKTSDNSNGQKHCLAVYPISWNEYILLKKINDRDPYLTSNNSHFESREILLPQNIISYDHQFYSRDLNEIKLSEDYAEDEVLERFFSPRIIGGNLIVVPPIPRKQELMYEFFTQKIKKIEFSPDTIHSFCSYYKLFGQFEPKEVNLWQEGNQLCYKTDEGVQSLPIPENVLSRWIRHPEEYEIYKQPKDPGEYIDLIMQEQDHGKQRKNQISKFNERMKKFNNINKESQPGDE